MGTTERRPIHVVYAPFFHEAQSPRSLRLNSRAVVLALRILQRMH